MEIQLGGRRKGYRTGVALISEEDAVRVGQYKWCLKNVNPKTSQTEYACARVGDRVVLLHRFILEAPDGASVDHINGNGLDNRRENLRLVTQAQNMCNTRGRPGQRGRVSKYKGVSQITQSGRTCWRVRIKIHGQQRFLGHFDDEIEAAKAYDRAAIQLMGEFARTNFPRSDYV